MKRIISSCLQETYNLGLKLGQSCGGGEVFALIGDLGAGKTLLAQGLAKGLGVQGVVNSPTFNILKEYRVLGNKKVNTFCHIDTYRLASSTDLLAIGVDEFFKDRQAVVLIEWAGKVLDILPSRTKMINIINLSTNSREITIFANKKRLP